jgi:DNA replication initiation complex subunit (GINS family)
MNLLGDAMKKADTKRIQKNIQANRKKDISSARKADPNDPSYNVKKLKPSERDSKKLITTKSVQSGIPKTTPKRKVTSSYNRRPNVNRASYNRGGFIKTGDGDKIVKRAYGGKVGS